MAAVSVSEFLVFAPEFSPAEDTLISAKLAEAERRCPVTSWGDGAFRAAGIMNKAAQMLALTPQGREMKLSTDDGKTAWDDQITRMNRIAAAGLARTAGVP